MAVPPNHVIRQKATVRMQSFHDPLKQNFKFLDVMERLHCKNGHVLTSGPPCVDIEGGKAEPVVQTIFRGRPNPPAQDFGIDIETLKGKVFDSLIEERPGDVDFNRTISRADA